MLLCKQVQNGLLLSLLLLKRYLAFNFVKVKQKRPNLAKVYIYLLPIRENRKRLERVYPLNSLSFCLIRVYFTLFLSMIFVDDHLSFIIHRLSSALTHSQRGTLIHIHNV